MDKRLKALHSWISDDLQLSPIAIDVASADASFRRYFRVILKDSSLIAMDSPPENEPLMPFIHACDILADKDVHVPAIYQRNLELGFLLLEDLGDTTYLDKLNSERANSLYQEAIDTLVQIQFCEPCESDKQVKQYSSALLDQEMQLFDDWYVTKTLQTHLSQAQKDSFQQTKRFLIETCLEQPQVLVHRDYHSRNLMVTPTRNPGVIDFQDMVIGPISYDLASLLKDCYIVWPREQQLAWLEYYFQSLKNQTEFKISDLIRWFDLTGLQRHIKVLGIFSRLNFRDNKPGYMNDIPTVVNYINEVVELYPELSDFTVLFRQLHD